MECTLRAKRKPLIQNMLCVIARLIVVPQRTELSVCGQSFYFGFALLAAGFVAAALGFADFGWLSSWICSATLSEASANVAVTASTPKRPPSAARGKSLSSGSGLPTLYKVTPLSAWYLAGSSLAPFGSSAGANPEPGSATWFAAV